MMALPETEVSGCISPLTRCVEMPLMLFERRLASISYRSSWPES